MTPSDLHIILPAIFIGCAIWSAVGAAGFCWEWYTAVRKGGR